MRVAAAMRAHQRLTRGVMLPSSSESSSRVGGGAVTTRRTALCNGRTPAPRRRLPLTFGASETAAHYRDRCRRLRSRRRYGGASRRRLAYVAWIVREAIRRLQPVE